MMKLIESLIVRNARHSPQKIFSQLHNDSYAAYICDLCVNKLSRGVMIYHRKHPDAHLLSVYTFWKENSF